MVYPILEKKCEKCGSSNTTQLINAGEEVRTGWYCIDCMHLTVANEKERILNVNKS